MTWNQYVADTRRLLDVQAGHRDWILKAGYMTPSLARSLDLDNRAIAAMEEILAVDLLAKLPLPVDDEEGTN